MSETSPDDIARETEAPAAPAATPNQTESKSQSALAAAPTPKPLSATASARPTAPPATSAAPPPKPNGTVVLDVVGGVLVPDFSGKPLRVALEEAESAGLELEVSGSGVGKSQMPVAGSRIPPGAHVSVVFGR